MKIFVNILLISLLISSCGGGKEKKAFLAQAESSPADLISLMDQGESQKFIEEFLSKIPKASKNSIWPRNGYVPSENLKLDVNPKSYDHANIGEEPKQGLHLTSIPIIADEKIFTLGGQGSIQARDLNDPSKIIWEQFIDQENLSEEKHGIYRSITGVFYESETFLGGNICYSSNIIFATTKRGNIYAISADSGKVVWTRTIGIPIRSAPVASSGKIIFTTSANKTYALYSKTGKTAWIHEGLDEKSKLSSSPAALIYKGKVILTYSSGEVFQLSLETGKEIWSALTSPSVIRVLNPSINDIGFSPIHHKGRVFVVTSDGRLVALDYATGNTLFEVEGYSISKPIWAVANSIFAVTKFGKLVSISLTSGKVVWKQDLADPEDVHDDKIIFTGPIMAEGLLYIANNKGELNAYSPENGKLLQTKDIADDVLLNPVVANGNMFLITAGDPKLIYFR